MKRGFVLVLTLLLCVLLMVLGMGYLGRRAAQFRGTASGTLAAGARALAEAGLEDARVKIDKDLWFPPVGDKNQTLFSYAEEVKPAAGGERVGYYFVSVDTHLLTAPDPPDPKYPSVYLVTSTGSLGDDSAHPKAVVTVRMEVNADEGSRGPNPGSTLPPTRANRISDWTEGVLPGP